MRPQSVSTPHCFIEPLESRQLCSVTVPDVTGHFNGGIFYNAGLNDIIDFRITSQQHSHFSGTFLQGGGAGGEIFGTVNKRGIATFTFQSTNLVSNYKGKARAALDDGGQSFHGQFSIRFGKRATTGTFSTQRVDILGEKSG